MTYILKDRKFFTDSESVYIMTYSWSLEVKLGSNRQIKAKLAGLAEMYPTYICFDSEFSPEFRLNIFQAQLGSSEVKLGANPSNRGPIGSLGRNIYGPSMSHQNTQNMRELKV